MNPRLPPAALFLARKLREPQCRRMCRTEERGSFVKLEETDGESATVDEVSARGATASTPPVESSALWREESGGPLAELMGGLLATILILVLNVTYAGVVMGGNTAFQPYLSHGISMCLGCTCISNMWLLFFRRNLPFVTVADSFMAVLFATTADNIAASRGVEADFGTLAAAMCLSAVFLGAGYVAVGYMRVCNVVQFVPTPVMAGYQASIGYLLLDSASTLASGCSLLNPQCFSLLEPERAKALTQLLLATCLGVGLHVATQRTAGVMRTMMMPSLFFLSTLIFQLFKAVAPDALDLSDWFALSRVRSMLSFLGKQARPHLISLSTKSVDAPLQDFVASGVGTICVYFAVRPQISRGLMASCRARGGARNVDSVCPESARQTFAVLGSRGAHVASIPRVRIFPPCPCPGSQLDSIACSSTYV